MGRASRKVRGVGERIKQTLVLGLDAREQGVSWGLVTPLRMPSLLPRDLCPGRSSSRWPPASPLISVPLGAPAWSSVQSKDRNSVVKSALVAKVLPKLLIHKVGIFWIKKKCKSPKFNPKSLCHTWDVRNIWGGSHWPVEGSDGAHQKWVNSWVSYENPAICFPRHIWRLVWRLMYLKTDEGMERVSIYTSFSVVLVVQLLSRVQLFATPWTATHQVPPSSAISQSLLRFMSIESVMPSNHLNLCRPLLLLPSIFPSIGVFSNESALPLRWPKYWSVSFSEFF